jgi:sodium-dependent dicarboxylate transporter 2/3/5
MKRYFTILISFLVFLLVYFTDIGIPTPARHVLAVIILAGILWFSEALPLHVTGLLAAFVLATSTEITAKQVFQPFFDPIIALFLGGFTLAVAMQKYKLDELMAKKFLGKIGTDPRTVLLGMMFITAFLSMWISNTASTLIMLSIAISILKNNKLKPLKSKYAKALILGVTFSATLGGIGTIVGSPPNAIAVKFLSDQGITVNFVEWMFFGLPLTAIALPLTWFILLMFFKPEISNLITKEYKEKMNSKQKLVLYVFLLTVMLWLTTSLHGISASVIALVPVILLYLLGLLNTKDFSKINWSALILFGSGLSLGSAINFSGLDKILASYINTVIFGQPVVIVLLSIALLGIILTTFASNTATAAIFVPIVMPLAVPLGIDIRLLTIFAAISVSLDFIVPIGTPPNTVACSSGYIKVKDMAKSGVLITLISVLILVSLFFLW